MVSLAMMKGSIMRQNFSYRVQVVKAENQELVRLPQQLGDLDPAQLGQLIHGELLQPGVASVPHQPGVGFPLPAISRVSIQAATLLYSQIYPQSSH